MKKLLKFLGYTLVALVCLVLGAVTYLNVFLPKVKAAEDIKIEATVARVARGKYLANNVSDCIGCHSIRDWGTYGGPIVAGSEYAGGEPIFDKGIGLPGSVPPKNLTPYNLKNYTDGQLVRALRTGVRANGEPLFPLMPYQRFAGYSKEDLYSIIAYLRSLPEVKKDIPEHKLDFPVNLIVRTIPKDAPEFPADPDRKDTVAYGKYLVNAAACMECHSPVDDHHEPIADMYLAGGQEYPSPDETMDIAKAGRLRIPNITPDPETGIGNWDKKTFLARFQAYRGKNGEKARVKVKRGEPNTIMPIYAFADMTDEDISAIYDYLRTIKPVKHKVERYTPPANL
ncbi:MAG: c-type cytochrome [candidate division FCPU426 bacterium]